MASPEIVDFAPVPRWVAVILCVLALAVPSAARAASAPHVSAAAAIVANGATGEILYARHANERRPMASITKIMTALVALERADLDSVATVDRQAVSIGEASMNLRPGEKRTVRELLEGMLIPSANDAAWALGEHVGGGRVSRFVAYMNERARELGLRNTHYSNPDGLDAPAHYSSARDILKLARQAMRKPLFRELVSTETARVGRHLLETTNDLLGTYPGTIGVKTGWTDGAGWSEVAAARRNRTTIYAVLLGAPSRASRDADLAKLLDWGFAQYRRYDLVDRSRTYATAAIPYTSERLALRPQTRGRAIVRVGLPLVERVVAPAMVDPPVRRGQVLGHVCVDLGKRDLCRPLVAAADVQDASFGRRVRWYAGQALHNAGGIFGGLLGAIS
jgi:serine-type D-Ala-D-Ala carboxypeptidase (penicillin-binding protein 5/6)